MSNFITITKNENVEWFDIKDALKEFVKEYLESGKALITQEKISETETLLQSEEYDSDIVVRIKIFFDEYVRPAVEQDGGAITFHSFKDGIVKVVLQGSCSGCPSSTVTLKNGIENLLTRMVPEVKGVEA